MRSFYATLAFSRALLTCQVCDKNFQNQDMLTQHMANHRTTSKLLHKWVFLPLLASSFLNGRTKFAVRCKFLCLLLIVLFFLFKMQSLPCSISHGASIDDAQTNVSQGSRYCGAKRRCWISITGCRFEIAARPESFGEFRYSKLHPVIAIERPDWWLLRLADYHHRRCEEFEHLQSGCSWCYLYIKSWSSQAFKQVTVDEICVRPILRAIVLPVVVRHCFHLIRVTVLPLTMTQIVLIFGKRQPWYSVSTFA